MLFSYILYQLALWWIFHTTTLFWKILFPFHARSFEVTHKMKYLHITCIIQVGLLLPLIPIITSVVKFIIEEAESGNATSTTDSNGLGYGMTRFPPILCTPTDRDAAFYSLILPLDVILAVGCTLLAIIVLSVHRVS